MSNLFEVLEKEHTEEQKASTAQASLIVAGQRFRSRLGSFVSKAESAEEFTARVELVEDEIMAIVSAACQEQGYVGNPKQVRAGLNEYIKKFYSAEGEEEQQNAGKKCPHCGSKNIAKMAEAQGQEVIKCDSCGKRSYGDPANNSVRAEITAAEEAVGKCPKCGSGLTHNNGGVCTNCGYDAHAIDPKKSAEAPAGTDKAYQHERQDIGKDHKPEGHPSEFNHDHTEKALDVGSKDHPREYQDVEQHDVRKNLTEDQTPMDFIKRPFERVDADSPIGDTQAIGTKTFGETPNAANPISPGITGVSKWHYADEDSAVGGSNAGPGELADMENQAAGLQEPDAGGMDQVMQAFQGLATQFQQVQQDIEQIKAELGQTQLPAPAVADQPMM
jgi:hypothetical protein